MGQFDVAEECGKDTTLQRLVALVAMAPRRRLSDAVFEQRKRAFANDQTTSHWPTRFDADDARAEPVAREALSPLRRWLVGYRDKDAEL
jgi:hypothetical protein